MFRQLDSFRSVEAAPLPSLLYQSIPVVMSRGGTSWIRRDLLTAQVEKSPIALPVKVCSPQYIYIYISIYLNHDHKPHTSISSSCCLGCRCPRSSMSQPLRQNRLQHQMRRVTESVEYDYWRCLNTGSGGLMVTYPLVIS